MEMDNKPLIVIFTSPHIDGITSFLIYRWVSGNRLTNHKHVVLKVKEDMSHYESLIERADSIYCFDVFLREGLELLNNEKVTFFDTHEISNFYKPQYDKAKCVIRPNRGSCSNLVLELFGKITEFTASQSVLAKLVDEIANYTFKHEISYDLHLLYNHYYKWDYAWYLRDFKDGYNGLSKGQADNIVKIKRQLQEKLKQTQLFIGKIEFEGIHYNCVSTVQDHLDIGVLDLITKSNTFDIIFWVNIKTNKVSIRKSRNDVVANLHLGKFAKFICDGDGHEYAAGGNITDTFLEYSKTFSEAPLTSSC